VIYKSAHTGSETFMFKFRADRGLTWEMALEKYKKEVGERAHTRASFSQGESDVRRPPALAAAC
jgi:hypothetical protein